MLLGIGITGTLGQLTMTRAYGQGKAMVSAALSYSGIVFSSLLGIAVWGDVLPWLSWAGIALIVGAGIIAVQFSPAAKPLPPPPVTND